MWNEIQISFYDLITFLVKKKYLFVLDADEKLIKFISKDQSNEIVGHVSFIDPPIRHGNVYLPIFKLEEIGRSFSINPNDLLIYSQSA